MAQSTSNTDGTKTLTDTLVTSEAEEQEDNYSRKDGSEGSEDFDLEDTIDNIV